MRQRQRTQTERTAETRQRLINAAIKKLLSGGMSGATVIEICREAEVTTGALQHQFGSKTGLMTAVVGELFRPFAEIKEPLDPKAPLDQRVSRLVEHYWDIYADERYYAVLEIILAARHDEELMPLVATFRHAQLAILSESLKHGFPDVTLPDSEMLAAVHRVIDLLRGYIIHRVFERSEMLDAAIIDAAHEMLLRKFGSPTVQENADG